VPLNLFNQSHPGVLTKRLPEVSYIKPGIPWTETAYQFVRRYLEDQSLTALLVTGDYHPRNHVQGSGGAMFFATFILAMIGLGLIIGGKWRETWWQFIIYGLAVSILPGAITNEPFHEVRLMSYAVFLLVLTVPALEWLLAPDAKGPVMNGRDSHVSGSRPPGALHNTARSAVAPSQSPGNFSRPIRLSILALLLAATVAQASYFQLIYRRQGPQRINEFDVPYKAAYDAAVEQPLRPIYLENGMWGPAYIDAYWYATVEGRPTSEFICLPDGTKPPSGAIVLSSNSECHDCQILQRNGCYLLYKAK
jgi:hypothetical protein